MNSRQKCEGGADMEAQWQLWSEDVTLSKFLFLHAIFLNTCHDIHMSILM